MDLVGRYSQLRGRIQLVGRYSSEGRYIAQRADIVSGQIQLRGRIQLVGRYSSEGGYSQWADIVSGWIQLLCSVPASHAKDPGLIPHNRQDWWHSPVTLLLRDKDMECIVRGVQPGYSARSRVFVIQFGIQYHHDPDYLPYKQKQATGGQSNRFEFNPKLGRQICILLSDCVLLAIDWRHASCTFQVSKCANKCTVQKVGAGAGKRVEDNLAHQTQIKKIFQEQLV